MIPGDVTFSVAGIAFSISLPPEPARLLRCLYGAFPPVDPGAGLHRLVWQETACHESGYSAPLRVPSEAVIPAVTTLLVGRHLAAQRPGWIFLHGNALATPGGGLLMLAGTSGAGKSTLSAQLGPEGFVPLAEDLLIIDPERAELHPFPRAATVRGASEGLLWQGLGEASEGKKLRAAEAAFAAPASLDGALLALLSAPGDPAAPEPAGPPCYWLTHVSPALPARVAALTGAEPARIQGREFPGLVLPRRLEPAEESAFEALLAEEGAMILRADEATASGRSPRQFPERPALADLTGADALAGLLPHVIRFGGPPVPAPRLMLRLAKALSRTRFCRFVPGGTPAESAALLAGAARHEAAHA